MARIINLALFIFMGNCLIAQKSNQECLKELDLNVNRGAQITQLIDCKYNNTEPPIIGTVISSFLDYETLSSLFGQTVEFNAFMSKWSPADGRSVEGSIYAFLNANSNNVPDMRGIFIRGVNEMGVNGAPQANIVYLNPKNVLAGVRQVDTFKAHEHGYNESKNKNRNYDGTASTTKKANQGIDESMTKPTGGSETRPKNISVYYYIRIN